MKVQCVCGRVLRSRSGHAHHGRSCPVERARADAFVAAIEQGRDPHAAAAAAVSEVTARMLS